MSSYFPVRPRPQNGESIKGYLLRLAKMNGHFNLGAIFHVIEIVFSEKHLVVSSPRFKELVNRLAPMLQLSEQVLFDAFAHSQHYDRHSKRCVFDITSSTPKVCAACLSEANGYLRSRWQLMHVTHCAQHETALLDHCPDCNSRLEWSADLLDGCKSCGTRWKQVSALPLSAVPSYQTAIDWLADTQVVSYLNALYQTAIRVFLPFELMKINRKECPFATEEAHEVFEAAYKLIISEDASQYHERIVDEISGDLVCLDASALMKIVEPTPKLSLMSEPEGLGAWSGELRHGLHDVSTTMVSASQAGELLGISSGELNELSTGNMVEQINLERRSTYQLRHIDTFIGSLVERANLLVGEVGSTYYRLSDLSKISHSYLFNFVECLQLIIDVELPLYCAIQANSLDAIYVDKRELVELLRDNEQSQFSRLLSMSELTKYFNVQPIKIQIMADIFEWQKVAVSRKSVKFEPSSIQQFVDEYILLDKWCAEELYPKSSLYTYLLNHGIEPIENPKEGKSKLHIFKRSPLLFEAIRQFEVDWFKSKAPSRLKQIMQIKQPPVLSDSSRLAFELRCSPGKVLP